MRTPGPEETFLLEQQGNGEAVEFSQDSIFILLAASFSDQMANTKKRGGFYPSVVDVVNEATVILAWIYFETQGR